MFQAADFQCFDTHWCVTVENHRRPTEWDRKSVMFNMFYKQFVTDLGEGLYDLLMRVMKQGSVIKPTNIILVDE